MAVGNEDYGLLPMAELSARETPSNRYQINERPIARQTRNLRRGVRSIRDGFRQHEAQRENPDADLKDALDQALEPYHSQLIALGGAIGTGLFIASGAGLKNGGPLSLLAAFSFVGFTLCPTILALGEMATLLPEAGGFFHHTRIFVHEGWAAAIGWNYAIGWLITMPLELVAASITVVEWKGEDLKSDWWVLMFLILIVFLNLFGVKWFANAEVVLSLLKVIAIVGFILFGICYNVGLGFGGHALGVGTWYDPGPVTNNWTGFFSVMIIAAFAYSGSEMVGMTAAEQRNPNRDMPKAIKRVFWRIGLFYICSIFLVGLLVKYTDTRLIGDSSNLHSKGSPFVLAIQNAGHKTLAQVVNGVILITVISVANSSIYASSRVLIAMAHAGMAPKRLTFIDQKGRPLWCFALGFSFGLLAFLAGVKNPEAVFNWFISLCGLSSIMSWATICYTHLRFRKALRLKNAEGRLVHNRPVNSLPFRSPFGAWGSRIGLLCTSTIIIIQFITGIFPVGWRHMDSKARAAEFFQSSTAFLLIIIAFFGFRHVKGTRLTKLQNVEFAEDTWHNGHYEAYAAQHPDEFPPEDPLWWVKPVRLQESLRWRMDHYSDSEDEPHYIPQGAA